MKIASFNVNSIRARMPVVLRWLDENKPDVLCIQETKVTDADFPRADIEGAGYHAVFRGEKSYNGVAILSREPLADVRYGFDGAGGDEGTRLITARMGDVHMVTTYVPQGYDPASEKFQYKLQWFERLRAHLENNFSRDEQLVWLGDFNVAPEPIDVHDPVRLLGSIGYHPDEHRALARVKEWGFVDVFRRHRPEGGQYTFWDYRVRDAVKKKVGWRIDHIWATATLAKKSTDAYIDVEPRLWERPSDHTVIVASFDA